MEKHQLANELLWQSLISSNTHCITWAVQQFLWQKGVQLMLVGWEALSRVLVALESNERMSCLTFRT